MIRAVRPASVARQPADMIAGWNITPNAPYTLSLAPSASACAVLLLDRAGVLAATGAAVTGADQPVVLFPAPGRSLGMLDPDLGWHLRISSIGAEPAAIIELEAMVDLPDEIHPVYQHTELALVRAKAAVDAGTHHIDEAEVYAPLLSPLALGAVGAAVWDGETSVGQVESLTFEASPIGMADSVVLRSYTAIRGD